MRIATPPAAIARLSSTMTTAERIHESWLEELAYAAFTRKGRTHSANEDSFAFPPAEADKSQRGILLAVADGVGGLAGGGAASREAVAYLQALFYAQTIPGDPAERLRDAVEGVNALNRLVQPRVAPTGGFLTTLVAALILGSQVWVANVGDSRAYLVQGRGKTCRQLTEDHTERARRPASDTPGGAQLSGSREHTITRAIGLSENCQVDIYHYAWSPGDTLILRSDGLSALSESEMIELGTLQPASQAAKALVERAIRTDGGDDATAVVAQWRALP